MPKPSNAQQRIIDRLASGAHLSLDPKTGRYTFRESGSSQPVGTRPVTAMIRSGLLIQDLGGHCSLRP